MHGSVSLQLLPVVWIFPRSLDVICYNRWVLSGNHKNYFKDWFLINSQPTFVFLSYFFGMLVIFTNLSNMEFQVRYSALFLLLSVIGGAFGWFWMRNLHKNTQLMLEFLKGAFFVLHFSCYTLMIFLMVLSVILLSILMILFSTLNLIRLLIYGNS